MNKFGVAPSQENCEGRGRQASKIGRGIEKIARGKEKEKEGREGGREGCEWAEKNERKSEEDIASVNTQAGFTPQQIVEVLRYEMFPGKVLRWPFLCLTSTRTAF